MSLPIQLDIHRTGVAADPTQGHAYFRELHAVREDHHQGNAMWGDIPQRVGERNVTEDWERVMIPINADGESSVVIPAGAGDDPVTKTGYLHAVVSPHNSTPLDAAAAGGRGGSTMDEEASSYAASLSTSILASAWWAVLYCATLVLLWMLLCELWRQWNLRSTHDPQSGLSHLPLPPGDFGLPLFGETLSWLTEGGNFNASRRKKHGNVFKTNVIGIPMVRVTGHDLVKKVLSGEHDKVTTVWPLTIRRLVGTNALANTTGAQHCHKRKIAVKAFSRSALNNYLPKMRKGCVETLDELRRAEEPKAYSFMQRLTFKSALSTLTGINVKSEAEFQEIYGTFGTLVSNLLSMPFDLPFSGLHKGLKARNRLMNILQSHVTERREKLRKLAQSGEDEDPDFLDALSIMQLEDMKYQERRKRSLNNNNNSDVSGVKDLGQTMEELDEPDYTLGDFATKEIILELFFAGYSTTASLLTSAMLEIARHPEVFRNLEEELLRHGIMREGAPSGEEEPFPEFDLAGLHSLQYLDQIVKETLRVRPPIMGGYRKAKKTFELGGYRIPKGFTVVYNIRDTHHYESGDLSDFDPDRFSQKADRDNKFKYLPFGGGPRVCVGQEFARLIAKIALVELVRHFSGWELTGKNPPTMRTIPSLYPADGMPVRMQPRRHAGYM